MGFLNYPAYGRHVEILRAATECVGQQLLCQHARKYIRMAGEHGSEARGSIDLRAVVERAGSIDHAAVVVFAPAADGVKVLQRETDGVHHFVTSGANGISAMLLHSFAQRFRSVGGVLL